MKKGLRFTIGFIVIVSVALQIYNFVGNTNADGTVETIRETKEVSLNNFLEQYKAGNFLKIEVKDETKLKGYQFLGTGSEKTIMSLNKTYVEQQYNVIETKKSATTSLAELGILLTGKTIINITYTEKGFFGNFLSEAGSLVIFFIIILIAAKFMLPKGGGGLPFNIKVGQQSQKLEMKTRFSDVAGMEEVKSELSEIVDYLKNPEKYNKVGARHPKGVLLYGQPGSGKTLLARAVAGEASVPFFSASGSEFMEMLVGMGAAKVRNLFAKAKAAGRAIIFIDEIDAIGKKRGVGYTGGHQEQEQTLNQILTEMDGFDNTTKIVVLAATNRPDTLDPALMRAGRFDRKVLVPAPTYEERVAIFEYYLKGKKVSKDININSIAKRTSGLVGADIENIVNEAALKEAKENRTTLENSDFEYALEKVIMGPEKKIKSMREDEKQIIAHHELGHAVTSYFLEDTDQVEKISIVRRGNALGATWKSPQEDQYLYSKTKFINEVISLLGGRAAEEIFFGKEGITTGASNDFERATRIITDMVIKYGMDEDIGPINFESEEEMYFKPYKSYSEKTAEAIDKKIKQYIDDAFAEAKNIIKKNKDLIENLSKILIEKEYLTQQEFISYMEKGTKKKK